MLVGFCIDQLDTDAEMARTSRDGALQYIADAEFLPDLPDGDRPTLVGKGSGARNDEAAREMRRQISDQIVDNAVDDVVHARVA
jgi:hypothetical protein